MESSNLCEGCGAAARMKCPTCLKLKLPVSYFCTQSCFKSSWSLHKSKHNAPVDTFPYTGSLRPGLVTPMRSVPAHITRPDYSQTGIPISQQQSESSKQIQVYSDSQIDQIRYSSHLTRQCLDLAHSMIKPGITTEQIDIAVHQFCVQRNAYPSPLNYYHFPKSVCTSVNEVVCHGIPDSRPLENGDICNVDVSIFYEGYHGDANETFLVGDVDQQSTNLVKTTYEALMKAIQACKPGTRYREIGNIIGKYVEGRGYSVVKSYTGHGVGRLFHSAPYVEHCKNSKTPGVMRPGHVFTIEPMVNMGNYRDLLWKDGWTSVTQDGLRSAQFEHSLMITQTGVEILTGRLPTSPPLEFAY